MDLRNVPTYQAGILQSKAHRALGVFVARLLRPHDLTMMQWFILGLVHDAGKNGARMGTISQQLDTTMAFVTNHVNLLESRGLVIRTVDPEDTRARIVVLNPKAKKNIQKIEAELRAGMRDGIYKLLEPKELAIYLKVLMLLSKVDK